MDNALQSIGANIAPRIDTDKISGLIEQMNTKLEAVRAASDGIDTTAEQIQAMSLDEIKLNERAISGLIKDATAAKRDFNREWKKPQQQITEAYDAELAHANKLHAAFKAGRQAKEDEIRAERYAQLQEVYQDAMLPELVEAVPMSRFIEQGKVSVAKSWSLDSESSKLLEKVAQVAGGYTALHKLDLENQEAAEVAFFRTLSIKDAINENDRITEEKKRIEALNQAVSEPVENSVENSVENLQETQPEQAEPIVENFVENPRKYTFTAVMLPSQKQQLVAWLQANGIHGSFRETANE